MQSPEMRPFSTFTRARIPAKNVFDAMEYAIDNNLAPVISTSYGNCEANLTGFPADPAADAQQANSQGQTITAASGDSGAADCEPPPPRPPPTAWRWIRPPAFPRSQQSEAANSLETRPAP